MAKLFIIGFPKDMQEIGLVEMFSAHCTVNTAPLNLAPKQSKLLQIKRLQ